MRPCNGRFREPNLFLKLFSGGVAQQKVGTKASTVLNNVDVSGEYVGKLKHGIEEHAFEVSYPYRCSLNFVQWPSYKWLKSYINH